jgi:hypothetical protein
MSDLACDGAREALRALVGEACADVVTSPERLAEYKRGTAVSNPDRDRQLSELPGFPPALESLHHLPVFVRAFGTEHDARATLQFVYEYFTRAEQSTFDDAAFEATFEAFIAELDDPNWSYVSFANLRLRRSHRAARPIPSSAAASAAPTRSSRIADRRAAVLAEITSSSFSKAPICRDVVARRRDARTAVLRLPRKLASVQHFWLPNEFRVFWAKFAWGWRGSTAGNDYGH